MTERVPLRPASLVMAPETLGAARLTRYSFSRSLLRTAVDRGWTVEPVRLDIDGEGRGEAVYEWRGDGRVFTFVGFTTTLDESEHTDRVIAGGWEISGALVDGPVDGDKLAWLRDQVPLQEAGRFDESVLTITRGNRSVRFFDYLTEVLAAGRQPDPYVVGDAGYIMRSTAFYANGKFGTTAFSSIAADHPLGAPYRAQMAAAFSFRELSYDVVESCARSRGGSTAVGFSPEWRRFFGLGNATGLGLVPYAFGHPAILNAWAAVREQALADVRSAPVSGPTVEKLDRWIARAATHFRTGTTASCEPFLSPAELVPVIDRIAERWRSVRGFDDGFDRLYRWAESNGPETAELVVSLLIELHDGDDAAADAALRVDESSGWDPTVSVRRLRATIEQRFDWVDQVDATSPAARWFWWAVSDNTDEPRRAPYSAIEPAGRDVAIDIALRIKQLRGAIMAAADDETAADLVGRDPELRLAIDRVLTDPGPYGEPRDNAVARDFLPLQTQRFQLACYGMDNFRPQSTDWLRVTLFQGAPRADELPDRPADDWALPPRPNHSRTKGQQ